MNFEKHQARRLRRANPSSTGRYSLAVRVALLSPLWVCLFFGSSPPLLSCQVTQGTPASQTGAETLPNSLYMLQNLHKQRDSSPQWLDFVKARGFIGELYTTLSRDNTPISLYHVVNPLADQQTLYRYPVVIGHGIASDAAQMVSNSELARPRKPSIGRITFEPGDTSLALMLANNNYDVWMADMRGASLNNHLVSDDMNFAQGQKFWNFSLDEQVHYDLTAVLDFVLAQTHETKLHYVGFSASTFTMFALLSSQRDYQDKLASFTALAPIAWVEHVTGIALAAFAPVALVPDYINANILPQLFTDTIAAGTRKLCQLKLFALSICPAVSAAMSGKGNNQLAKSYYSAAGKSTSIKAIKHLLQLYAQRRLGMYDYGASGNQRQYGTPTPPRYRLQNIVLPTILLFRGGNDFLSTQADQRRLLAELGARPHRDFFFPAYNHLDFVVGRNVVQEVNVPIAVTLLDLTREHARLQGRQSILRDPAGASLPKPHTPVLVLKPDGSRALAIKSNLVRNLANGWMESTSQKIVDSDAAGHGQLASWPSFFPNWRDPFVRLPGLS